MSPDHKKCEKLFYRIGEVRDITGIPVAVLTVWEGAFNSIKPKLTTSGQRLFSKEDLALFLKIRDVVLARKDTLSRVKKKLELKNEKPAITLDEIRKELIEIREILAKDSP